MRTWTSHALGFIAHDRNLSSPSTSAWHCTIISLQDRLLLTQEKLKAHKFNSHYSGCWLCGSILSTGLYDLPRGPETSGGQTVQELPRTKTAAMALSWYLLGFRSLTSHTCDCEASSFTLHRVDMGGRAVNCCTPKGHHLAFLQSLSGNTDKLL